MDQPETSSMPHGEISKTESTSARVHNHLASQAALRLLGCYRKGEASDPETFTAAVAATLADYPADVIAYVTDPRTGLPARSKWIPNPAEVREACEQAMAPIYAQRAEEAKQSVRQEPTVNEYQRARVGAMLRNLAEDMRMQRQIESGKSEKYKPTPVDELLTKYGVSREVFDQLPDARRG